MYDIAFSVEKMLAAGTRVDIAWVVDVKGFSSREPGDALAITPGGGRVGSLLSGAANEQLAELVGAGVTQRLVDVQIGDVDAAAVGLACGGVARCVLVPAAELPGDLWDRLRRREPIALVTGLEGDRVLGTTLLTGDTIAQADEATVALFGRGVSDTALTADAATTVLWPVPKLVIVGDGGIVDALASAAALLGWQSQAFTDASSATGVVAGLAVLDKVVVVSHDEEVAGPALMAALSSPVGYVGAVGSRHTQQARADWLARRDVTDLSRVHGPAGLDIGAKTPPEIAVSILAEALAVASATTARSLRDRPGPIHSSPALPAHAAD